MFLFTRKRVIISISLIVSICLIFIFITIRQKRSFIDGQDARLRVEKLREVCISDETILELDRYPTQEHPYYHFRYGLRNPAPHTSALIKWYAVDAYTGKVYNSSNFKEISE